MRNRGRPPTFTGARRYPNQLNELRRQRGLSQQALAAAAGMSTAYYGALERGDKRINADTAARLAVPLGCSAGDLLVGATAASVPLAIAVAAAEAESRPDSYDLPEPHERLRPRRLAEPEGCFAAEIVDNSADLDFAPGTVLFVRPVGPAHPLLPVGARVLARFFLGPYGGEGRRATHEILYGILDCNIVGDLVLVTRTQNRLVPRNLLVQSAAPRPAGLAEHGFSLAARDATIAYEPRDDDPAVLLGRVVYAMAPV